jgi:lipoprotein NlpD
MSAIEVRISLLGRRGAAAAALGVALWLSGCASSTHRAPVEDRREATPAAAVTAAPPAAAPTASPAAPSTSGAAEHAGKAGYYTVKPGDTLIRIGLDHGQNWRDIARWSALGNANLIEVGQVLRVLPPGADAGAAVARPVAAAGRVESKPLTGAAPASAASAAAPVSAPGSLRDQEDDLNWAWPAAGPLLSPFDESKSKGLGIGGKAGDPVLSAADGRVVYAGSGLRGYGNLVIIKHNATYLTAYAHNQSLLVKEDQAVRRGQKIAEMGSSDAERVQLHFEIRRQGKPIDPRRLLPAR